MKKHLALGTVLLAVFGLFCIHAAGATQGELQPRAYLPVVEKAYDEIPLPPSVAWSVTQLAGPPGYVTSLAATSNGSLLALSLTNAGIQLYQSLDEGGSWGVVDEPVLGREVRAYRLYASPPGSLRSTIFALGFSGVARLGDGGVSWQRVDTSLSIKQLVGLAFSPDYETDGTIYALSVSTGGIGPYLYVSRDLGQTWQTLADIAAIRNGGLVPNDLATFGPAGLVIATSTGIPRTEDGGNAWQQVTDGFAEPGSNPAIRAVARLSSGELLAASSGQRIPYKSNDGGITWHWTGTGMDDAGQYQGGLGLAVAQGRVFLAVAGAQGNAPGLFYSPDGNSWRPIPLGLAPGVGISALYALSDDKLLVAAGDQGLWKAEAIP